MSKKILNRNRQNDKDIVFRIVRITAQIWQTHPFQEGNTRSVIVFVVRDYKERPHEYQEHEKFKK